MRFLDKNREVFRPALGEKGNVMMMILVAIALLAALTAVVSQQSSEQSDGLDRQTMDDQISRLQTQASTLGGALNQMLINGENPATLYSSLSLLKPGEAGYETSPHNLKIYHPYGGGVTFMPATSGNASAVGTALNINAASIVTGVGPTNVAVGDILFTARISTAEQCGRVNKLVTGSTTVPAMATATFNALFTAGTTVTLDATACAACVNVPQLCVSNTGGTAWGYYAALLPG